MSQALTLYESEQHLAALADTAAVVTEEQLAEFASDLARATEYGLTKRDNCIRFILHMREQIAFSKAERKRLADREAAIEAGLARFEAYLLGVIAAHGKRTSPTIRRLEGRVGDLCAVDGNGSVEITDPVDIPLEYRWAVVEMPVSTWETMAPLCVAAKAQLKSITYDKAAIKAAIKAGETVPGATLKYSEGLQIK